MVPIPRAVRPTSDLKIRRLVREPNQHRSGHVRPGEPAARLRDKCHATIAGAIRLDRRSFVHQTARRSGNGLSGKLRQHRSSHGRGQSGGEKRDSHHGRMPLVCAAPCHDSSHVLFENNGTAVGGTGGPSPTRVGVNHPERAHEERGADDSSAECNAVLGERLREGQLLHSPAQVVRYSDQAAKNDLGGGAEAGGSSRVAVSQSFFAEGSLSPSGVTRR